MSYSGHRLDISEKSIIMLSNNVKVTQPSGTMIVMKIHETGTHIYSFQLKPSLADWKSTSGLCGVLDGNKENDFTKRDGTVTSDANSFGLDWRLNPELDGDSLFAASTTLPDIPLPPLQYCKCRVDDTQPLSSEIQCNLISNIGTCNTRQTNFTGYMQQCDKSRMKRETHGSIDENFEVPKFDINLDEEYKNVAEVGIRQIKKCGIYLQMENIMQT
ncbi:von Willebrand factor D and EGF domain-containing protein-like [Pecten maximus]|uniref:von Willebrand factor D and EGF domain-containing protein-like n=1 Tax=Pecten maximus TaxID=6579 RepID=UPI001458E810|nr:von Willebrand factor D and EGF domain-containing protein-like [Pecten maximus]